MADEPQATPSFYAKYIKPRYCTDPMFRQKVVARSQAYNNSMRYSQDPEFLAKRREAARKYYHSNPEYRARKNQGDIERRRRQQAVCGITVASDQLSQ